MIPDPLEILAGRLSGVPGQDGYFPPMALATIDLDGTPDVRTVLLSEITAHGLAFHTDIRSRKVEQILRAPSVGLMLTIPERAGQIVVRGVAAQLNTADLASSYLARSRYLQVLAWLNTPEMASVPEVERRRRWAEYAALHPDGTLSAPPEWTGFSVQPQRITFWQGEFEAPSHRIEYTRADLGWSRADLPG